MINAGSFECGFSTVLHQLGVRTWKGLESCLNMLSTVQTDTSFLQFLLSNYRVLVVVVVRLMFTQLNRLLDVKDQYIYIIQNKYIKWELSAGCAKVVIKQSQR